MQLHHRSPYQPMKSAVHNDSIAGLSEFPPFETVLIGVMWSVLILAPTACGISSEDQPEPLDIQESGHDKNHNEASHVEEKGKQWRILLVGFGQNVTGTQVEKSTRKEWQHKN